MSIHIASLLSEVEIVPGEAQDQARPESRVEPRAIALQRLRSWLEELERRRVRTAARGYDD